MSSHVSATMPFGYSAHLISSGNYSYHDMRMIKAFYAMTPGSEKLLARQLSLAAMIAIGQASLIVAMHNRQIVASAAAIHGPQADEIASVLVSPDHRKKGLDQALRDVHLLAGQGKPQVMFERFAVDIRDKLIDQRAGEGWSVLPENSSLYQQIESTKPASCNPTPKTGFVRATTGTLIAHNKEHDRASRPAAFAPVLVF